MRPALICGVAWLAACKIFAADTEPVSVGNTRQLFFDDRIVSSAEGLARVWHQSVKSSAPVLVRERAWEGNGPYVYGTVLREEPAGPFKLWYNCYVGGRPDYYACYATSRDGLRWDRPAANAVRDPRLPEGHN